MAGFLENIDYPSDLKKVNEKDLPKVCAELRELIIREASCNPGHFGASMGVVDLTVALHYAYNTPYDKLIWDVGHQAYGHKILTGMINFHWLFQTERPTRRLLVNWERRRVPVSP